MKKILTLLVAGYLLLGVSQKAQAQGAPLRANITSTTNVACNGGNTGSSTVAASGKYFGGGLRAFGRYIYNFG